jgi:hypothetical protein
VLGQDRKLKAALPAPLFEMCAQAYFVKSVEFLVETTDITKRLAAA